MPRLAGKSADSKGSAKMGYMMGGSKMPSSHMKGGGGPPKTKGGMIRSAKKGT